MVTLVEQHVIKASDPRFEEIDAAAFAAKNLYNLGNYTIWQSWLSGAGYIPYTRLYHLLNETEAYQALPLKVSQLVVHGIGMLVIEYNPNWKQRVKNQKFVSIPHTMLVDMLTYKAELAGIQVVL